MITKDQASELRRLANAMLAAQHKAAKTPILTVDTSRSLYLTRNAFMGYVDSITEGDK